MSKLIANLSKKLPIPGAAYSCRQYGAGVEVELPEGATAEEIRQRLKNAYALLEEVVDAELARPDSNTPADNGRASESRHQPAMRFTSDGGEACSHGSRDNRVERGRWGTAGAGDGADSGHGSDERPRHYDSRDGAPRWRSRGDDSRDGGRREWGRSDQGRYGRGNGPGLATAAQVKAIFAIAKNNGLDRRDLLERIQEQYQRRRVEELSVRQASEIIESLKMAESA